VTGLLIIPDTPVTEVVTRAVAAERLGYDAVWVADEKFYRDPFVALTAVAAATERIRIGTCVTEPYARHPALIAMAMGTLAEVAPDRVIVGIGSGGSGFPPMGVSRRRPAAALRDAVTIIRRLLAGEEVDYEGEVVSLRGGRLNFRARPLPIYVAGRGPRVVETAGAIADGVIVAPFASPAVLEPVAAQLGAAAEGRDDGARPPLVARVDVCVCEDGDAARDAVRTMAALPIWSSYPNYDYLRPSGIEVPPEVLEVVARRRYEDVGAAGRLLPAELIDHFAVAGTREQVRARLRDILGVVDEVLVHPIASPDVTAAGVARIAVEYIKEAGA
jgi:5,10-methylenetetrahydromethanopterin reductase